MIEITNPVTITEMMRKKQELEVMLAWELLDIFNDEDMKLLEQLRTMVINSIVYMDKISNGEPLDSMEEEDKEGLKSTFKKRKDEFRNNWEKDWSKLYFKFLIPQKRIVGGKVIGLGELGGIRAPSYIKTEWDAEEIKKGVIKDYNRDGVEGFSAQHCADWIRVFGEVLEKVVKGKADQIRVSWQKGGDYHWKKYEGQVPGPQQDSGRRRVQEKFHKQEVLMPDYEQQKIIDEQQRKLYPKTNVPAPSANVWGFQRDITQAAGLGKWMVMKGDTTAKMDQVFGLMPGATISGTTTDNIDFLKRFGGLGMNPIYYLLPLATIVGCSHHSMLEVALPLMLNRINDYRVGLYSTLYPLLYSSSAGEPPGVKRIKYMLNIYENRSDNKLMLIYYPSVGRNPAGCFVYDTPKDKQVWGKMIIREPFMEAFKVLRPFPTRQQLMYLMGQLSL